MNAKGGIQIFILKLEHCFPQHEVMTTFGVIYPQFWATNGLEAKKNLHIHLNVF
jgi:hypothetical protein